MSRLVVNKYSPDKKHLSVLFTFLVWLIVGFIICLIGINNVFADEMERVGYLSDKTDIQIVVPYNGTPLTLDQYGEYYLTEADQLLVFIDNYNFIGGNIYQLELYLPNATLTNADMFTISGTSSTNESVSCTALKILQDNKQYVNYRWRCNKDVDSLTFTIKNSNNENIVSAGTFRWDYSFLWNVLSTTDNSEIIDGLDKVEDAIIESNKETQDVIKDELNTCRPSYNLLNVPENYSVTLRDIFEMNISKGTYILSFDSYNSNGESNAFLIQFYNSETSLSKYFFFTNKETTFELDQDFTSITIYSQSSYNGSVNITTTFNKLMLQKGSVATTYEPYGEEICTNKLDEAEETRKGIWQTIKELPSMFLDMLLGLFIPDDLSFIDNFKDVISNKLGFIASVPIQIIDFMLGLVDVAFTEITTISFPSIEIFGVHFWDSEEIDITILLEKLKPFKYFTDLTCVILCCRTLYVQYHNFTGGDAN